MIKVTALTLLSTFLAWYFLHLHSLSKTHVARPTPFFSDKFEVIADRGDSLNAPENTLIAFEKAVSAGKNIILKMDIRLTTDKQVVVFHDETLDRTTNGTGPVWTKSLADLKTLDAGFQYKDKSNNFTYRNTGVTIPTLGEVLQHFKTTRIVLDLKQRYRELGFAAYEIIKEHSAFDRVIVMSEYNQPLNYLRKMDPRFYFGASRDEVLRTNFLVSIKLVGLDPMKPDSYFIPKAYGSIPALNDELVSEVHKRGKKIYIESVNEPEVARQMKNNGLDGIMTNNPAAFSDLF